MKGQYVHDTSPHFFFPCLCVPILYPMFLT